MRPVPKQPVKQVITLCPKKGYDCWAKVYDTNGNPLTALDDAVFRDNFRFPAKGKRTIDLGCGTGRVTAKLAKLGAKVTAVDFSENMMSLAMSKTTSDNVEFVTADLNRRLPFPSGRFDLATACLVVEHIRDKKRFFRETRRILKPGGSLYLSEMHPAMLLLGNQANFTDPDSGHEVRPRSFVGSLSELAMTALAAGFEIVSMREYAGRKSMLRCYPKMARYVGWPMLAVMALRKEKSPAR